MTVVRYVAGSAAAVSVDVVIGDGVAAGSTISGVCLVVAEALAVNAAGVFSGSKVGACFAASAAHATLPNNMIVTDSAAKALQR